MCRDVRNGGYDFTKRFYRRFEGEEFATKGGYETQRRCKFFMFFQLLTVRGWKS